MHDLTNHNYGFIAALFVFNFLLFAYVEWAENNIEPHEFTLFGKFVNLVVWCLSKTSNIGLGIAVGIEFFMMAHGG